MKKHRHQPLFTITSGKVDHYATDLTSMESEPILDLISNSEEELEYTDMISGRVVGQLLRQLVAVSGATRILEIGTFTGYSALMMAEVMPEGGELITVEMNMRYQDLAERHFRMHPAGKKIRLVKANAREYVQELDPFFDLIYLDADKIYYPEYFEYTIPLLRDNGLLIADNVLWDATVLNPEDPKAEALHRFNKKVHNDKRTEQVLLPVRDGVTIIRRLPT